MSKFLDIFEDVTRKGTKIPTDEYLEYGKYPIIDQGQAYISGYRNNETGLFTDVPAIIFGDHTRIIKYIEQPCFLGADGVKLLKAKNKSANYKYLYYALCNAKIPNTGYNRHFKWLKEIEIPLPSFEIQNHMAENLDKITHIIDLSNKILSKFDKLVKSRFVELFGDILCNDKGWPIYTLDTISSSRLGKMLDAKRNTGRNSFPYLANFNVQWFEFDLSELHEMDFNDADREEFSLKDGDLLVTEGGEVGRCAIWHNEVTDCYFQKALHRVRCDKNIILPEYLAWWFKFHSDFNGFEDIVGGKATIAHLPGVKLKKLQIEVPDINVQKDFVSFWREIDKSKLAVKECLEKAEYLKSALMQEYFG